MGAHLQKSLPFMTDGNSKDTEWETPGISFNNRKQATRKNVNQTSDFVSWPGFQKLLRCIETTNNILKNQKLSYKLCYGLNVCDLQIFIYWSTKPHPKWWCQEGGLWEVIRLRVEPPWWDQCLYKMRHQSTPSVSYSFSTPHPYQMRL